jgi:hypothetical protein
MSQSQYFKKNIIQYAIILIVKKDVIKYVSYFFSLWLNLIFVLENTLIIPI